MSGMIDDLPTKKQSTGNYYVIILLLFSKRTIGLVVE